MESPWYLLGQFLKNWKEFLYYSKSLDVYEFVMMFLIDLKYGSSLVGC